MESDVRRTGPGELCGEVIDRLDHQMHVDRRADAELAQRLADRRAERQVRHVMIVHHVEVDDVGTGRSEEHTSELQSLMRISYAVFCLKKKKHKLKTNLLTYTQH